MHVCDLTVRLAGSLTNTVRKTDVTPAEIMILKAIHGDDAVVDIVVRTNDRRTYESEWDRLQRLYASDTSGGLMDAGNGELLERLFPGAIKQLPKTMKDIGLGHLTDASIKAPAAEPAPAPAAADEDDGGDDGDS